MPVVTQRPDEKLLIHETSVCRVYGAQQDVAYTAESKLFGSDSFEGHIVHSYATMTKPDRHGWVHMEFTTSQGYVIPVDEPYHLLRDGMLFALKRHKFNERDSFGFNHELLSLEWDVSFVLHYLGNQPYVFVASRGEWLNEGHPGARNRELQVFLRSPAFRSLPVSVIPDSGKEWLNLCLAMERY